MEVPVALNKAINKFKKTIAFDQPKVATRKSSEMVLNVINPIMTETIGGPLIFRVLTILNLQI